MNDMCNLQEYFNLHSPSAVLEMCRNLIEKVIGQTKIMLMLLQLITGTLDFACQVVSPGRAFLRRLINLSIGLSRPFQHVRISSEANKDLQRWLYFLRKLNGKKLFSYGQWTDIHCAHRFTDASGSLGYGAIFENPVAKIMEK